MLRQRSSPWSKIGLDFVEGVLGGVKNGCAHLGWDVDRNVRKWKRVGKKCGMSGRGSVFESRRRAPEK